MRFITRTLRITNLNKCINLIIVVNVTLAKPNFNFRNREEYLIEFISI